MGPRDARRGRRGIRTALMVAVAHERMEKLMGMAAASTDAARAKRYVTLAGRIGMRYNVKMPPGMRASFCHSCHTFFHVGRNCRVRLSGQRISRTCLECGNVTRRINHVGRSAPGRSPSTGPVAGTVVLVDEEAVIPDEGEEEP